MTATYDLRAVVRAEQSARHTANVAAAGQRREIRAELRREAAIADWTNLLEMLAQPGRPVPADHVRKLAEDAKVGPRELGKVLAHPRVAR